MGDSYTYGIDVETDETYSARLESTLCNAEALNMGAAGYGIDQAYLKYHLHGRQYDPNVVVFGIYTADYLRATLPFRWYAKPYFKQTASGKYILQNYPVPNPLKELKRIQGELDDLIFTAELVRRKIYQFETLYQDDGINTFLNQTDNLIRYLLSDINSELKQLGKHLLILHIPHARMFVAGDERHATINQHLITIYNQLKIPYINLQAAFLAQNDPAVVYRQFYIHSANDHVGHLSAKGHEAVAQLIINKFKKEGYLPKGVSCTQHEARK